MSDDTQAIALPPIDGAGLQTKDVEVMQRQSLQARARSEGRSGRLPLLMFLARAGQVIPPWWSKARDRELDRFWKDIDHLGGAFYTLAAKMASVDFRVEPRDPSVAAHRRLAGEYQELLEAGSEFGQGWQELATLFLQDYWITDNGGFLEVIGGGPKDGALRGLPVGLAHLDSFRCHRTGSLEYPVQYEDEDGKLYRLHRSRVLFRSQMPSPRAEMYRVGVCWASRCVNAAQNIQDVLTYKQEKLGSRPKRAIMITKGGLDPDDVMSAFQIADAAMDAQGLSRHSKIIALGDANLPDADMNLIDLASLPDGFDYETDVTLAMYTIALAGGFPPRWIWPATVTGATKADAMYQHVSGLAGGPGATLKMLAMMLGGPERGSGLLPGAARFLPPSLKMTFDFQDDEQDRTAAEIWQVRAQARSSDLSAGVLTVRTAREIAVEDGEITGAQFEDMELEDGRLPDGSDVLSLFQSPDPQIMVLLVPDPDAATVEEIDAKIRDDWESYYSAPNASLKRKARQAIAALEALKGKLETVVLEEAAVEAGMEAQAEGGEESPAEETPPEEETEPEEAATSAAPFEEKARDAFEWFGRNVRAAARILWKDPTDVAGFVDTLDLAVLRGYEDAFQEGARQCGITPADRTPEEQAVLAEYVSVARSRIFALAEFVIANAQPAGGRWRDLQPRLGVWINRYQEVKARAQQMACRDAKLQWVINPEKESCTTCLKLSGRIYRASVWRFYDIFPRDTRPGKLNCRGFSCGCALLPTTEPVTPGRPPNTP